MCSADGQHICVCALDGATGPALAGTIKAIKAVAVHKQAKVVVRRQGATSALMHALAKHADSVARGHAALVDGGPMATRGGNQAGSIEELLKATLSGLTDRGDVLAAADAILQFVPEGDADSEAVMDAIDRHLGGGESTTQLVTALAQLQSLACTDAGRRSGDALRQGGHVAKQLLQAGVQRLGAMRSGDAKEGAGAGAGAGAGTGDGADGSGGGSQSRPTAHVAHAVAAAIGAVRSIVASLSTAKSKSLRDDDEQSPATHLGLEVLPYLIEALNKDYAIAADALQCIAQVVVDEEAAMTVAAASDCACERLLWCTLQLSCTHCLPVQPRRLQPLCTSSVLPTIGRTSLSSVLRCGCCSPSLQRDLSTPYRC